MNSITENTRFSWTVVGSVLFLAFGLGIGFNQLQAVADDTDKNTEDIRELEKLPLVLENLANAVDRLAEKVDEIDGS